MKLKMHCLIFTALFTVFSPLHAQSTSCLDNFSDFTPIQPVIHSTTRNESSTPVAVWYTDSRCMVVDSSTGLWLYDIDQPENPLRLAQIDQRAISAVAINPVDSTIAFSVGQESIVYFVHSDGKSNTLQVSGQAVTAITFSPDGTHIAVASSMINEIGLYYNPRLQIWNSAYQFQFDLELSGYDAVAAIFFSLDSQYLLTHSWRQGYIGDKIDYWELTSATRIWSYDDLLMGLERWSENDPLAISSSFMHDQIVAVGGLDGWHDYDDYYGSGIHLWDAVTQERKLEIAVFRRGIGEEAELVNIAFNSAGTEIVSSQTEGTIRFWNVADGNQTKQFQSDLEAPEVSFSPNEQLLAVFTATEIQIWNIAEQEIYATWQL